MLAEDVYYLETKQPCRGLTTLYIIDVPLSWK